MKTRTSVAEKATKKSAKTVEEKVVVREAVIDEYGIADEQEKSAKKIKKERKEVLVANGLNEPGTYFGDTFAIQVDEVNTPVYDLRKVIEKAGIERILAHPGVLSVSGEKVKELLSTAQLNECVTDSKSILRFTAKRKK